MSSMLAAGRLAAMSNVQCPAFCVQMCHSARLLSSIRRDDHRSRITDMRAEWLVLVPTGALLVIVWVRMVGAGWERPGRRALVAAVGGLALLLTLGAAAAWGTRVRGALGAREQLAAIVPRTDRGGGYVS